MDIVYVLHSLAWNDGKNIKATQLLQLWMESYILIYFLSGHYICGLLFLLAGARACTHADIVLLEWWQEYQSNSTATTLDGLYILISFLSGHYICCLSFYLQACECTHTQHWYERLETTIWLLKVFEETQILCSFISNLGCKRKQDDRKCFGSPSTNIAKLIKIVGF